MHYLLQLALQEVLRSSYFQNYHRAYEDCSQRECAYQVVNYMALLVAIRQIIAQHGTCERTRVIFFVQNNNVCNINHFKESEYTTFTSTECIKSLVKAKSNKT